MIRIEDIRTGHVVRRPGTPSTIHVTGTVPVDEQATRFVLLGHRLGTDQAIVYNFRRGDALHSVIPTGSRVQYHGTHGHLHGSYTIEPACTCDTCHVDDRSVRIQLRADAGWALKHVRPASVTLQVAACVQCNDIQALPLPVAA